MSLPHTHDRGCQNMAPDLNLPRDLSPGTETSISAKQPFVCDCLKQNLKLQLITTCFFSFPPELLIYWEDTENIPETVRITFAITSWMASTLPQRTDPVLSHWVFKLHFYLLTSDSEQKFHWELCQKYVRVIDGLYTWLEGRLEFPMVNLDSDLLRDTGDPRAWGHAPIFSACPLRWGDNSYVTNA